MNGFGSARCSQDLQGLFEGSEIVGGDEDRGRVAVAGDCHALMGAFDLRDVLGEPVSRVTKGYSSHAHSVAKTLGKTRPHSCHDERRDAHRDRCAPGCRPCRRRAGASRCLSRALPGLVGCNVALLSSGTERRCSETVGTKSGAWFFVTSAGTALDSVNVRGRFRRLCAKAGLSPEDWAPRELRHSFVSLMSDADVPLEEIARLVGHGSTKVAETVYRKQLRPILTGGTQVMACCSSCPRMVPTRARMRVGHSVGHSTARREPLVRSKTHALADRSCLSGHAGP